MLISDIRLSTPAPDVGGQHGQLINSIITIAGKQLVPSLTHTHTDIHRRPLKAHSTNSHKHTHTQFCLLPLTSDQPYGNLLYKHFERLRTSTQCTPLPGPHSRCSRRLIRNGSTSVAWHQLAPPPRKFINVNAGPTR